MIRKQGNKYYLYSQDGSKKLGGPYNTRSAAEHREKQVNYFKSRNNAAKRKAKTNGASSEPIPSQNSSIPQVNFLGVQAFSAKKPDAGFRTEKLLGRDYLVVPVTALVEGVIQGVTAAEPELALATEFGKFPQGWNGRPVVMDHPEVVVDNQAYKVSANSPQILEKYQFGFMFNTQLIDNALQTEAWIDTKRAEYLSDNTRWVLNTLRNMETGEKLEVSTGLFTGQENHSGKYNGKDYSAIWAGVVPDHLAFLPEGALGACSVADGCGAGYQTLRANCAGDPNCSCGGAAVTVPARLQAEPYRPTPQKTHDDTLPDPSNDEESAGTARKKKKGNDRSSADSDTSVRPDLTNASRVLRAFESKIQIHLGAPDDLLDSDVRNILQSAVSEMYPNDFAYVVGFTNNAVVYMAWDADDGDYGCFQVSYTIQDNKSVLFGQDVTEVLLTTQITPIEEASSEDLGGAFNAAPGPQVAGTTETIMNVKDARTVLAGIVSDPENLKTMSDADVLKLHAKILGAVGTQGIAAMAKKKDKKDSGSLMEKDSVEVEPQQDDDMTGRDLGDEAAPQANQARTPSFDEILANADPAIRESIQSGMKMHAIRKDELIKALKATNRCDFTDQELKAFSLERLESLVKLAQVPQDYSGLNRVSAPATNQQRQNSGFAPKPPSVISAFAKGKSKGKGKNDASDDDADDSAAA